MKVGTGTCRKRDWMNTDAPPVNPRLLAYSRYHCNSCGHLVAPDHWLTLSHGYRGARITYLVCPACLSTQRLRPGPSLS